MTDPEYDFHEIDAGRALTHMQLAAWERDIGSRIYTVDAPEVEEFLEAPEEIAISAVVGFGRPAEEIQGLKDRKPLDEIAYRDRFGQRLDW